MKRAANKTGGGGGVALQQPTLKAAAPCFLIFPDHQNKPVVCMCVYVCVLVPFVEDNSLDLREKQSIVLLRV